MVKAPRHPDIGVIAMVPERWGPHWMSRHHVLTRLSRHFHVIWMNPPYERGTSRPWLGHNTLHTLPEHPHLTVYDPPPWLPRLYRPFLASMVDRVRLASARAALRRRGCARIILYLWRPAFAPAVERVPHDLLCYHVVDEYTFSSKDLPVPPEEEALIRRADQVIFHTTALLEKKGAPNPTSCVIPLGVDYDAFSASYPEPEDLRAIPRPRIGYTGHLKKQLDWNLLVALARGHPEWSWVYVGGRSPHAEIEEPLAELDSLPNVYFVGAKPSNQIPAYLNHLDVGVMPYVLDDYAKYGSPLKLQEYLAAGLPAVGVPMRALREHEEIVHLAEGLAQWEAALAEATSPEASAPLAAARRREYARAYRWEDFVEQIATVLLERLPPDAGEA